MPVAVKPLFRPETLAKKLAAYHPPPTAVAARPRLEHWANLVEGTDALRLKETELLPEFVGDLFRDVLGYTGPAAGSPSYTLRRESLVRHAGRVRVRPPDRGGGR
jgi:hypothetical protein